MNTKTKYNFMLAGLFALFLISGNSEAGQFCGREAPDNRPIPCSETEEQAQARVDRYMAWSDIQAKAVRKEQTCKGFATEITYYIEQAQKINDADYTGRAQQEIEKLKAKQKETGCNN